MINGEMKVAQEGIRLPQSLELDMVVRPARGGRKRCTTAAAAVATEFVGVEAAFRCKSFDEREQFRVRDPLFFGVREEGGGGLGWRNDKEAAEGRDRAKEGAWDIGNGDFDGRAIKLTRFGETDANDCTPLNKTEVATCEVPGFQAPLDFGTKFPDRRKEKKPTQRAAQRARSLGILVLTWDPKATSSSMVRWDLL